MDKRIEEFVVPYETKDRGSMMVGELRSEAATFPNMVAQFSKFHPYTRKVGKPNIGVTSRKVAVQGLGATTR